jgi:multiple sugar transport system substrate-binding protein
MGVADWMMAFKQNGHADQIKEFLSFVYNEENVLAFSREYDLLPVTNSASQVMSSAAEDADLRPFLEQLPVSELYPVGRTSWASVSAEIKQRIGQAVTAGGSPSGVLGQLQATATTAESGSAG